MEPGSRALAYIRISELRDRAEETNGKRSRSKRPLESPRLQRNAIDAWAAARGIEVVGEVRDLNRSGGTLTRPGLEKAMRQIPELAEGIIVARGDRASRKTLHGLGLIDTLAERGGWIAAADGTIDTSTRTARMATTMHFAMGENELERFRETSASIHAAAILEKGRHMGPAPFGYRRDEEMRLVIEEREAAIVRSIFQRRADGGGWVSIARDLENDGVRQANGNKLNATFFRRMILRRVYVGEAKHGEHSRPHAHPAIVDEGLFAAANRIKPVVRSASGEGRAVEVSLLRGLIRCAGCRYVMKRHPQRRAAAPPRWNCRSMLSERAATHDCESPARIKSSEHETVEAIVIDALFRVAEELNAEQDDSTEIADIERRLSDAESLLDELSTLDNRRKLGAQRWQAMVDEASEDAQRIRQELATARARRRPHGIADRATLEQGWSGMTLEERQSALRDVFQAVMIVAGDSPIAERVFAIPMWEPIDLPRKGIACDAGRWTPADGESPIAAALPGETDA